MCCPPSRLAAVLVVVALAAGAFSDARAAEGSEKSGRLADGRAYRIDANGYRLIDQVAELEVTNDDLRRQLAALEQELSQKQTLLDRLQSGKPAQAPVKEANLVARDAAPPDCSQVVSALSLKVAKLEAEMRDSRPSASPPSPTCDYYSSANPLWSQVTRLQQELMQGPSDERFKSTLAAKEDLEIELARTRQQLQEASGRVQVLESDLERQRSERATMAKSSAAAEAPPPAAAADEVKREAPAEAASVQSEALSKEEIASLKKDLQQQLAGVTAKIGQRKALLDSLKGKGKGVAITAQPLVTKDGRSLDSLRSEMRSIGSGTNGASLRQGLVEIARLLEDDISVLKRLNAK